MRRLGDMSERWTNVDASCGPMDASYQEFFRDWLATRNEETPSRATSSDARGCARAVRHFRRRGAKMVTYLEARG